MIYKKFKDINLSSLGFGCMRLPTINNDYSNIDKNEFEKMVDYAIKNKINYFDTAWGYHDGKSEEALGNALSKYDRSSFYLATKFPGYDLSNMAHVKEIFNKQLKKCKVDYFDFYLFHNVCEMNIDAYLDDEKYNIFSYLMHQKEIGKIKHLGFSVHGNYNTLNRFLEKYGKDMEFCQIQLNYIDYEFQEAYKKMELLEKYNIPVWVMEPLRGGKLANLSEENVDILKSLRDDETVCSWAFRFLQSYDNVVMILSGMSNMKQLMENIETFKTSKPLNNEEMKALLGIAKKIVGKTSVPCTACRYCTSHCPMNLDIPELIKLYNEHTFTGGGFIAPMIINTLSENERPSACLGCKSCEAVCPQNIKISEVLEDFAKKTK